MREYVFFVRDLVEFSRPLTNVSHVRIIDASYGSDHPVTVHIKEISPHLPDSISPQGGALAVISRENRVSSTARAIDPPIPSLSELTVQWRLLNSVTAEEYGIGPCKHLFVYLALMAD